MEEAVRQPEIAPDEIELIYTAGQWQLAWRKFKQNRLALIAGGVLGCLYAMTLFSGFLAPYGADHRFAGRDFVSPQGIHFFRTRGFISGRLYMV